MRIRARDLCAARRTGIGRRLLRPWPACLAGLLALALPLSGCTSLPEYVQNRFKVGPNYAEPPAPVAQDWIDAADMRVRKASDDLSAWWTVFHDPALDSLICHAYRQNLTLREAGFRVLQARAEQGVAVGNFFPQTQEAFGRYSRKALSKEVANRQFIAERFFSQWDFGFGLAWELDFWGRYRRAIEAADAVLNASVESYDDVLVTLLGDVAQNYVQLRTYEQQIRLTRTNVELQRKTLTIAQARSKATKTELDVDQARSNLAQTQALIPELEIKMRKANNRLCILLGIAPEELRAKLGPAAIPVAPADVAVGIPAELLWRRPDVRRAEREAAAQSARIGVAEADFYPQISITGTFQYSAEQFKNLFGPSAFAGSVGPSFRWNVLNYGRILNNVRAADAQFRAAVVNYQNTVLKAGEEVENGLATFLRGQERAGFLGESVNAAEKAVAIAVTQYAAGFIDFNRVALLQQNLVQQQTLLAQAQGEVSLGLIQVYRALGGGWQIRYGGCVACDPLVQTESPSDGDNEPVARPATLPAPAPVSLPAPDPTVQPLPPPASKNFPAARPATLPETVPLALPPLAPEALPAPAPVSLSAPNTESPWPYFLSIPVGDFPGGERCRAYN